MLTFASFSTYSTVGHIATIQTPDDAELVEVPAVSLDDAVHRDRLPPPSFVKIDVEGAELAVLQGAQRLLEEHAPTIACEVRPHSTLGSVSDFLGARGYAGHDLGGSSPLVRDYLFQHPAHSVSSA